MILHPMRALGNWQEVASAGEAAISPAKKICLRTHTHTHSKLSFVRWDHSLMRSCCCWTEKMMEAVGGSWRKNHNWPLNPRERLDTVNYVCSSVDQQRMFVLTCVSVCVCFRCHGRRRCVSSKAFCCGEAFDYLHLWSAAGFCKGRLRLCGRSATNTQRHKTTHTEWFFVFCATKGCFLLTEI